MVFCNMIYKYALLFMFVALPFFVLGVSNAFNNRKKTLIKFIVSCLVLWGYLIAVRFFMNYIDVRFGGDSAAQNVFDSGGAKMAFLIYFGWVPSILMSFLAWIFLRAWIFIGERMCKVKWLIYRKRIKGAD